MPPTPDRRSRYASIIALVLISLAATTYGILRHGVLADGSDCCKTFNNDTQTTGFEPTCYTELVEVYRMTFSPVTGTRTWTICTIVFILVTWLLFLFHTDTCHHHYIKIPHWVISNGVALVFTVGILQANSIVYDFTPSTAHYICTPHAYQSISWARFLAVLFGIALFNSLWLYMIYLGGQNRYVTLPADPTPRFKRPARHTTPHGIEVGQLTQEEQKAESDEDELDLKPTL